MASNERFEKTTSGDDFQTPPEALIPLLAYLPKEWTIWEPAYGKGYLVDALRGHGFKVIASDIKDGVDFFRYQPSAEYDMILTNPPYIDPKLSDRVQESVLHHEPEQALWGGQDGMELITEILQKAPDFLNPNGVLYIEHEPEQVNAIHAILPGTISCPDQYGLTRFSVFTK